MIKLNDSFLGFTDSLKPMQKAKIENILNEYIRSNGIIYRNKEFILTRLQEGYRPYIEYNYSYYISKTGEMTKPKDEYRLTNNDNSFYTINKTLYNFAEYLENNNLIEESVVNEYITKENERMQAEQQKQLEQEQKERLEKEAQEQAKTNFENWLNNEIESYNNSDKLELAKEIFINELGQYSERQLVKLLVLINNIDNSMCRAELKLWLHNGNVTSKKVFYHVTGIKLHSTDRETMNILNTIQSKDFTGIISYKKRQKHNVITETFYKLIRLPEPHFEAVIAEPINKYGLEMFIIETAKGYELSEAKTGCLITTGNTKQQVIEQLKNFIDKNGIERINNMLEDMIIKNGISPKYKVNEAV